VGDRVILFAKEGAGEFYPIPWDRSLLLLKEENIGAVVKEDE
jgi:hypothetical protein